MMKKDKKPTYLLILLTLLMTGCKDSNGITPEPETPGIDPTGDINIWVTTGNEAYLLKKQTANFSKEVADFTIALDTATTYQSIDGFGAALTGSSAYLIKKMDAEKRAALLSDLFDPAQGAGINYLRITIGSSDFSLGTYSYCDTDNINAFAIPERDRNDLLPVLKEILKINPDIRILASPWSAPAWMKQNKSMYGGSLLQEEAVYESFAEYFVRYIKAFENEGITIDAITIQNEPMYENGGYPTMKMEWQEQNVIIRDYLGPRFAANNIKTKIIIWDHNFDKSYYPMNILNDVVTRQYVAGTGWHGYGGTASAIDAVQAAHPDKDVYFTEQSGGGWNTDSRMGNMFYYMKDFLMASVNRGSKNFLMWNLALDESNGPTTTTGGCQECRGVVTIKENGSYTRNEEYYLIGHFSKAVRLNARRIKYTANKLPDNMTLSAFLNEDGSKTLVVMNRSGELREYNIRCGGRRFKYKQPDESVVTFNFD